MLFPKSVLMFNIEGQNIERSFVKIKFNFGDICIFKMT